MEVAGVLVLAAGAGTRMNTETPKVLHTMCGKTLVGHVLDSVKGLSARPIIVIGHQGERIREYLGEDYSYVYQENPSGTGHAVMEAVHLLPDQGRLVILCGDTPLLSEASLRKLVEASSQGDAGVLTAEVPAPKGYGRIIRAEEQRIQGIVEEAEASSREKEIQEINTGTYCIEAQVLKKFLPQLKPSPNKGEYYLTDVITLMSAQGHKVIPSLLEDHRESMGVNTLAELYEAEKIMRQKINHALMDSGVRIVDPSTTYIDKGVKIGPDSIIYPHTYIEGNSILGEYNFIGPSSHLQEVKTGRSVCIRQSVVEDSTIGDYSTVGPFAYLRPGSYLEREVKVGDFVEIKNSTLGERTKVPHLSYVGDAEVGAEVNFGAGSIIVNYDGRKKHRTVVERGAFIGCNSNLIAPIRIGEGAYVGAGSTVSSDVPAEALALERSSQVNKPDIAKKLKGRRSSE